MKTAFRSLLGSSLPYLFLFGTGLSARAQNPPGVTDKTIVIGSCSALEGPSHSLGAETGTGANAYFSLINEEGGGPRAQAQVSWLRRQLPPGEDGGLLQPPDDPQGLLPGGFCGHPDGREIRATRRN